jgi:hypothetical protein
VSVCGELPLSVDTGQGRGTFLHCDRDPIPLPTPTSRIQDTCPIDLRDTCPLVFPSRSVNGQYVFEEGRAAHLEKR